MKQRKNPEPGHASSAGRREGVRMRVALISILLFILYFSGSAAAVENPVNTRAVAVSPGGVKTSGDPGIALLEVGAETAGIEPEDLVIDEREGFSEEAAPAQNESRDIEHEDIGVTAAGEEETGNVETEFKVEKGERSTGDDGPGGVVFGDGIKGERPSAESEEGARYKVEVRGWDPVKKTSAAQYKQTDLDFILSRASRNVGELEEYTKALAQSDPNIENIEITESTVAMGYKYPAKLLWLVDVNYTMTTTVDTLGRVKVQRPWWIMFSKNNAGDISGALESALATLGGDGQLANIDLQSAMQKQQQILQTMSSMQKASHDAAMATIRNIK